MYEQTGRIALGACIYFCWTMGVSQIMRSRYRRLALAEEFAATAHLLRGVANQIVNQPGRKD